MTDKPETLSRRTLLTAGSGLLTTSLAGCSTVDFSNTPTPEPTPESNEWSGIQDGQPFSFKRSESSQKTTYDELIPVETDTDDIGVARNSTGTLPDDYISVTATNNTVEIELTNIKINYNVTLKLYHSHQTGYSKIGEKTISPTTQGGDESYTNRTVEFTTVPQIQPNVENKYTILATSPEFESNVLGYSETTARQLTTHLVYKLPYTLSNGDSGVEILQDESVNFSSAGSGSNPPRIHENDSSSYLIEHEATDETTVALFTPFIDSIRVNSPYNYAVTTTISNDTIESHASTDGNSPSEFIPIVAEADDWPHFSTLAESFKSTYQILGIWDNATTKQKLKSLNKFISGIEYKTTDGGKKHPTTLLLDGTGDCSEKTSTLSALLQTDVFGIENGEYVYISCKLNGNAHIISGFHESIFNSPNSDWDYYGWSDRVTSSEPDAPTGNVYIPSDPTNGFFGRLPDSFSDIRLYRNQNNGYSGP